MHTLLQWASALQSTSADQLLNLLVLFAFTKVVVTNTVVGDLKLTMLVEFMSTFTSRVSAHIYARCLRRYLQDPEITNFLRT
jgi:hypothetical protein